MGRQILLDRVSRVEDRYVPDKICVVSITQDNHQLHLADTLRPRVPHRNPSNRSQSSPALFRAVASSLNRHNTFNSFEYG